MASLNVNNKGTVECVSCSLSNFDLKRKIISEVLPLLSGLVNRNKDEFDLAVAELCEENVFFKDTDRVTPGDEISRSVLTSIERFKCAREREFYTSESPNHMVIIDADNNLKMQIEDLKTQIASHIVKVDERKETMNVAIQSMQSSIDDLFVRYDNLEQYGRSEILELKNVAIKKSANGKENILDVVQDFFRDHLNEEVRREDISTCHRVLIPAKEGEDKEEAGLRDPNSPTIYVKFAMRDQKTHMLKKKWMLKGQRNENGFSYFINENLTEKRRILFKVVKKTLRSIGWQYVWTKNGEIMARKRKGLNTLKVNSYEKLDKITAF